jgi:hypothetical protein
MFHLQNYWKDLEENFMWIYTISRQMDFYHFSHKKITCQWAFLKWEITQLADEGRGVRPRSNVFRGVSWKKKRRKSIHLWLCI